MPGLPYLTLNLTAYLAGKGYNADSLNPALDDAKAAVLASDKVRSQSAMKTFANILHAKVKDGSINKAELKSYAKDHTKALRFIHTIPQNSQHVKENSFLNKL